MGKRGKRDQDVADAGAGAGKTPRCTERQMEERLAATAEYLLRGWTDRRVAATMAEDYGVSINMGYRYVADVKRRWAEEARARAETPPEDIVKEHADRFRMLMELSLQEKSLKTAIMAAERLAQLEGLLTTKSVQHSGKVGLELNPEVDEAADAVLRGHGYVPPAPPVEAPEE